MALLSTIFHSWRGSKALKRADAELAAHLAQGQAIQDEMSRLLRENLESTDFEKNAENRRRIEELMGLSSEWNKQEAGSALDEWDRHFNQMMKACEV
jgi:Skp family chaperone for outer membrane proteins